MLDISAPDRFCELVKRFSGAYAAGIAPFCHGALGTPRNASTEYQCRLTLRIAAQPRAGSIVEFPSLLRRLGEHLGVSGKRPCKMLVALPARESPPRALSEKRFHGWGIARYRDGHPPLAAGPTGHSVRPPTAPADALRYRGCQIGDAAGFCEKFSLERLG